MSAQNNIAKLGIFLGVIAGVAAGLLAVVNGATKPSIEANAAAKKTKAMMQVLPEFKKLAKEQMLNGVSFTPALDAAGKVIAVAAVADQEGFSGKVEVMVGIDPDGSIRKVLVTKQTETPGLGTVITDRKEEKTINDLFHKKEDVAGGLPANQYLDQYETVTADTVWKVVKDGGDIDAKTGATITSRAVCGAVSKVYAAFNANREELLKGGK